VAARALPAAGARVVRPAPPDRDAGTPCRDAARETLPREAAAPPLARTAAAAADLDWTAAVPRGAAFLDWGCAPADFASDPGAARTAADAAARLAPPRETAVAPPGAPGGALRCGA
jgi:hypothetical protein